MGTSVMNIDPNDVTVDQPESQPNAASIDPADVTPDQPQHAQAIDPNDVTPDEPGQHAQAPQTDYESVGQQAITGLEGAVQGLAGPLATLAETHILGVDPKDIAARAAANPWTHGIAEGATMAGSLALGVGEAGLIAKGAAKVLPASIPVL